MVGTVSNARRSPETLAHSNGSSPALPEDEAIRRLALLDLAGARAATHGVLDQALLLAGAPARAAYLLYDLLSRAERVVADHQCLARGWPYRRLETIRRLSEAATAQDLAKEFWSVYDEITHVLGSSAPDGHPVIEKVKAFVQGNFTRRIPLGEIARAAGVSSNYLSHLFRRHCGVTLTEYIQRLRLRRAEALLLEGHHSVAQVASLVGYGNYRDFHRNFVRYRKTSPNRFRQIRWRSRGPAPLLHR